MIQQTALEQRSLCTTGTLGIVLGAQVLDEETFQLYGAGDYTYKVENGLVTSMAVQIADDKNDKIIYNKILNALAKSNSIKDTHNTGGNYYQYASFQVQFDDFEGYEKLTFSALSE